MSLAVRYDLVDCNLAQRTRPVRVPHGEPIALSLADIQLIRSELTSWIAAAPVNDRRRRQDLSSLVEVALGTGLRIGELLALRLASVDFANARLRVSATCSYSKSRGHHISETLKHSRQARVLALPQFALAAIHDAVGDRREGADLIFCGPSGVLLRASQVRSTLREFVHACDLEQTLESVEADAVTFHLFRRTVATHLARHSGLEHARDQLGHARVSTTEQAYVQRAPMVDPRIGELLERVFSPAPSTS